MPVYNTIPTPKAQGTICERGWKIVRARGPGPTVRLFLYATEKLYP